MAAESTLSRVPSQGQVFHNSGPGENTLAGVEAVKRALKVENLPLSYPLSFLPLSPSGLAEGGEVLTPSLQVGKEGG